MVLSFLFSRWLTLRLPGLKEGKKTPREGLSYPAPDSDLSNGVEFGKISVAGQDKTPRPGTAGFKFDKRGQLLIRMHNETLSVVTMCVRHKDRSPVGSTAPTPTGFAEIVSDDFPSTSRLHLNAMTYSESRISLRRPVSGELALKPVEGER
jgi:hypothetical protein